MAETMSSLEGPTGKDTGRAFFDRRFIWTEKRRVNRLAFILLWSILMWFFVKAYVVSVGIVGDISMQPTLAKGGYYLVNRYVYHFVRPERGDIVLFRRTEYGAVEDVKRIVGLPGETLTIRSSAVYINGRRIIEPYAVGGTYPDFGPYAVEKNAYFVLGDTRWVREDSRDFGTVPLANIRGKIAPDRLFPFR
ncbi:MAG: signal peptidase I [Candidatus Methylomirabilales bacterium]